MSNCDLTISEKCIQAVNAHEQSYCKFISANDSGETGGHQSGVLIHKTAASQLFNEGLVFVRGENLKIPIHITWQDDLETDSVFTYYGRGTRNECRITQFGRGFPFFRPENTGDLMVLVQVDKENYRIFVLSTEDDINSVLDSIGISSTDTGRVIENKKIKAPLSLDDQIESFIQSTISNYMDIFPSSMTMSSLAREIHDKFSKSQTGKIMPVDKELINWINMEYRVFRSLEYQNYGEVITRGFKDVDSFIEMANSVLNRRKSRAGKSLENHLAAVFDANGLNYTPQCKTEGNKKPDFIFPGKSAYHDPAFIVDNLTFLGAKTTCKDRWRQVINEAGRIETKHLFTLQQGISEKQIDEMLSEKIVLVVPKEYHGCYPKSRRDGLWTLEGFLGYVKSKQNS
jgi:type II restriction enzyme